MATDCGDGGRVAAAQVGLSTGSLHHWALDRVFELAAAAGYDGVELLVDARMDSSDVPYLRRLVQRWGVPILSVHSPFVADVEGWSGLAERRVEQAVRLAEELGASTVVAHLPVRWQVGRVRLSVGSWRLEGAVVLPWRDGAGARYARWLQEELPALQARTGVRVAIENMPAHRGWVPGGQLHWFNSTEGLRQFPHVVLDTTHWGTWGVEPVEVYRALRERVAHVHLSDYDGREHRLPGKGKLRLWELLAEMGRDGFSGIVVVEVEPSALGERGWAKGGLQAVLAEAAAEVRGWLLAPSHSHYTPTEPVAPASSDRAA